MNKTILPTYETDQSREKIVIKTKTITLYNYILHIVSFIDWELSIYLFVLSFILCFEHWVILNVTKKHIVFCNDTEHAIILHDYTISKLITQYNIGIVVCIYIVSYIVSLCVRKHPTWNKEYYIRFQTPLQQMLHFSCIFVYGIATLIKYYYQKTVFGNMFDSPDKVVSNELSHCIPTAGESMIVIIGALFNLPIIIGGLSFIMLCVFVVIHVVVIMLNHIWNTFIHCLQKTTITIKEIKTGEEDENV